MLGCCWLFFGENEAVRDVLLNFNAKAFHVFKCMVIRWDEDEARSQRDKMWEKRERNVNETANKEDRKTACYKNNVKVVSMFGLMRV